MNSIWLEGLERTEYPTVSENMSKNIVVIGGGIAGILIAYELASRGEEVTLLEANQVLSGVTSCTTAHVTALQGYVYQKLLSIQSLEFAKRYYESQIEAIARYEKRIKKHKIECDWERHDAVLYTHTHVKKLYKEFSTLQKIGADVKMEQSVALPNFSNVQTIRMLNQASFHPLKFLVQLPKKFEIFEQTRVVNVDLRLKKLITDRGYEIMAKKIIIATNYPIVNVRGGYFLKLKQSNSYALGLKAKSTEDLIQSDIDEGITLRRWRDYAIVGGLDHETGKDDDIVRITELKKQANAMFRAKAEFAWCANDVMTYDGVPFAGTLTAKHDEVFVCTGFNKWGMANAMACSLVIADAITGNLNRFAPVFCPQRKNISAKILFSNLGSAIWNVGIKPLILPFSIAKNLPKDSGKIVWYRGKKKAVYKDASGELHACQPYCKHMGCQLSFNDSAKTWDCPCHGSRYDVDGNILKAPTTEHLCKQTNKQQEIQPEIDKNK